MFPLLGRGYLFDPYRHFFEANSQVSWVPNSNAAWFSGPLGSRKPHLFRLVVWSMLRQKNGNDGTGIKEMCACVFYICWNCMYKSYTCIFNHYTPVTCIIEVITQKISYPLDGVIPSICYNNFWVRNMWSHQDQHCIARLPCWQRWQLMTWESPGQTVTG